MVGRGGGGWEEQKGVGEGGGFQPSKAPPPNPSPPQVAVAAGCAQLRVEVGGEGAPLDPPSFGAVDLGSSEGWLGVSFQGAALRELAGAPPPKKGAPPSKMEPPPQ